MPRSGPSLAAAVVAVAGVTVVAALVIVGLGLTAGGGEGAAGGGEGAAGGGEGAAGGGEGPGGDASAGAGREPFRPEVHFTPARNWMNDPNGPVLHEGDYHLFYQYNPLGDVWGNIGWGHAVSRDLFDWGELDMALEADGTSLVFSGNVVVDTRNTSGLCAEPGCLVAIFTEAGADPASPEFVRQAQSLAWSDDDGLTWHRFEGNPVLDVDLADFRDPSVFWHDSDSWVMAVARPVDRQVAFYRSPDLIRWELVSEFGPRGQIEGIWECPVLVELAVDGDPTDTRWLLKVDHNPGHVTGGSGGQYFVGRFDGWTFTPDPVVDPPADPPTDPPVREVVEPRWVDHGADFYCALPWTDGGGASAERTMIAWMSNWAYAADIPTAPWRGMMTLPQEVSLRTVDGVPFLVRRPVDQLTDLRTRHRRFEAGTVAGVGAALRLDGPSNEPGGELDGAFDLEFRVELGDADEVLLAVHATDGQETVIGYDVDAGVLWVDRRRSGLVGFAPGFPARHDAPLAIGADGVLDLRVVVDRSSVEVFAQDGLVALTNLVFPDPGGEVRVWSRGGSSGPASLDIWALEQPD